jgi:hypothetical protein
VPGRRRRLQARPADRAPARPAGAQRSVTPAAAPTMPPRPAGRRLGSCEAAAHRSVGAGRRVCYPHRAARGSLTQAAHARTA